jgi:hypothetical protein
MGIVRFALKIPWTFCVLATLIVFLDGTAIMTMPADIFPNSDIPVVSVIWQYTGLSAPEMEQRVNGLSVEKIFFSAGRQPRSRDRPDRFGDQFQPSSDADRYQPADRGRVQCLERSCAADQLELRSAR